jgi:hypothetical protein
MWGRECASEQLSRSSEVASPPLGAQGFCKGGAKKSTNVINHIGNQSATIVIVFYVFVAYLANVQRKKERQCTPLQLDIQ